LTGPHQWRRCSACKKPIDFGAAYWVCNVSTCNRKRTGLVFCTVSCWEVHLPSANHREAWALEKQAPTEQEAAASPSDTTEKKRGRRREIPSTPRRGDATAEEVLIVASRLKEYIRAKSGMNTSERVLEPLSEIVRRVCDEAIGNAAREGRRTVLDRDVPGS
jgi:hypothetical protein